MTTTVTKYLCSVDSQQHHSVILILWEAQQLWIENFRLIINQTEKKSEQMMEYQIKHSTYKVQLFCLEIQKSRKSTHVIYKLKLAKCKVVPANVKGHGHQTNAGSCLSIGPSNGERIANGSRWEPSHFHKANLEMYPNIKKNTFVLNKSSCRCYVTKMYLSICNIFPFYTLKTQTLLQRHKMLVEKRLTQIHSSRKLYCQRHNMCNTYRWLKLCSTGAPQCYR